MGNVIGMTGTADSRNHNWNAMLMFRSAKTVLDPNDPWENRVIKRDTERYNKYLARYVA